MSCSPACGSSAKSSSPRRSSPGRSPNLSRTPVNDNSASRSASSIDSLEWLVNPDPDKSFAPYDESYPEYRSKASFFRDLPSYLVPPLVSQSVLRRLPSEEEYPGQKDAWDAAIDELIEQMYIDNEREIPEYVEYSYESTKEEYPNIPSPKAKSFGGKSGCGAGGAVCGAAKVKPASTSFAGKGVHDASGMTQSKFEPWAEKNTSWRRTDDSPIRGPHEDIDESDFNFSDPVRRQQQGFDPYVHMYEMKKFASPYKDFGPLYTSTPYNAPSPNKKTKNAWKYHSLVGEEEESFWRASSPCSPVRAPKSPKHKNLKPNTAPNDSATAEGIKHVLGEMEFAELTRIQKDLRDFQKARRRLIFDATQIKPIVP